MERRVVGALRDSRTDGRPMTTTPTTADAAVLEETSSCRHDCIIIRIVHETATTPPTSRGTTAAAAVAGRCRRQRLRHRLRCSLFQRRLQRPCIDHRHTLQMLEENDRSIPSLDTLRSLLLSATKLSESSSLLAGLIGHCTTWSCSSVVLAQTRATTVVCVCVCVCSILVLGP
jgi:hypothetical protein